jgi:hypothetical protein
MPYIANPLEGLPIRNSFITDAAALGTTPATDDTLIIYDLSSTAIKQLTIANLQASILASPTFTGTPAGPTANAGTSTTQLATTAFVTTATTALNTVSEMTDVTISGIASGEVIKWNGSAWINNTLAEANLLPAANPTFTGTLTVGSAAISEADLEQIDDLTAGTAVASKALVVDNNKDIGTLRNLTIDGTFSDGNYTFDTSGNVTGLGTIGSGNITSTGTVQGATITATTAFVPDASDGAALGTTALEFSDLFLADGAVISLGDDDDVTLTHVVDTGILLSSTDRFQFGDAGTFIHQSADGVLTIESDTTVDINGAVAFNGALTGITDVTISGTLSDGNYTFDTSGNVSGLGTISGTSLATSAAIPLLLTNGQLVNIALTSQSSGATTLTIPDFASVADTFVFATLAQTLVGKTLTAPTINGVVGGTATSQTITTLTSTTVNAGSLVAAAGSITDSSGAITFDDENLTTTGTISAGNLTVTGTTTTVNSTVMTVVDPIIHLQTASGGGALGADTNKDVGLAMQYHNGSAAKTAFLGFDDSVGKLTFIPDATIESEVITSGSVGTIVANLEGNASGTALTVTQPAQTAITSVGTLSALAVTGEVSAGSLDINGNVDISGSLTMSGGDMDASDQHIANIKTATFVDEHDNANSGTSDAIDWREGLKQKTTMTGNCEYTFTAPAGPCNLMLSCYQDGTVRTITWPSTVKWPASTAPTFTGTNGVRDIIAFYYDGTHYFGQASLAFPA